MTKSFKARFDGKVLVPEGPVDLPTGASLEVQVAIQDQPNQEQGSTLADIAEWASKLPPIPNSPGDAAAQHDHYLYGSPKRP
jgi:hypothetical protein